MEADGHELVPLQHHRHDLPGVPGVAQDGGSGVVVRLPRLPLASVEHLEDPGNLLGVGSDHVTLGHRSHMEHLTHEYLRNDIRGNLFRDNVDKQAGTAWISLNRNTGKGRVRDESRNFLDKFGKHLEIFYKFSRFMSEKINSFYQNMFQLMCEKKKIC